MTLSRQSDATALFQQSAILSVTLTLTFRSLSIPESKFSGVKPSYGARATADCHIPELMNSSKSSYADGKLLESHFDQTKPSYKLLSC